MSTGGRKAGSSTNAGVRTPRTNVDAARTWVAEDRRAEAKEMFAQHTKETSGLDVLSRCKKLNELLSSDVLKGKGDPKAQLKEILGILHAGPKRPAFLDKPPVTATAGKQEAGPASGASTRSSTAEARLPSGTERCQQAGTSGRSRASDDVDDVINLLNDRSGPPASSKKEQPDAAERARREREAQQAAEDKRRAQEAQQKEAERKRQALAAQQEAERKRKTQEEAERNRAAAATEALKLERLRQKAATCIQASWRGYCARKEAAKQRKQLAAINAAACVLQSAWRTRQVIREYRRRVAAASKLQAAVRAGGARRCLHRLRVEAFIRHRAARIIQRAFSAYRARYTLGPLRVPATGRPPSSKSGVDGAALLAKQLRLRSAVDARLAPECNTSSSASQEGDGARNHKTVVTHKERVRQVSASERNRRCDVSERAIMVASEHRDSAEALAIARQGYGTPTTPRTSSPSTGPPPSRSDRPGSGSGGVAAPGHDGSSNVAVRPPSGKRLV